MKMTLGMEKNFNSKEETKALNAKIIPFGSGSNDHSRGGTVKK